MVYIRCAFQSEALRLLTCIGPSNRNPGQDENQPKCGDSRVAEILVGMTTQELIPHSERVAPHREAAEREAIRAVLESGIFAKRPRLATLLEYICERYFEGDIDAIKEYSIAMDVFRRPPPSIKLRILSFAWRSFGSARGCVSSMTVKVRISP